MQSDSDLKKPLLLENTVSNSVSNDPLLLSQVKKLLDNNKLLPTTGISTPRLLFTGFLAALSGLMYFFSARKAGVRYDINTHNQYSWFFVWFLATSSGVTNTEFNWQAFVEISDSIYQKIPRNVFNYVIKPVVAVSAAVGTISPFWLTASNSGEGKVVDGFINLAAALNIPVCVLGAYILFGYVKSSYVQRLRLRLQSYSSPTDEEIKRRIDITYVKDFLIAELRQRDEDFYYGTSENRQSCMTNLNEGNLLNNIFIDATSLTLPLQLNIIHQSDILWYLKYFVLGPICMSQNFPHVIEAYEAGESVYPSVGLGFLCAVANLIPGLAFTIVGIMGFGFVEVFFETALGAAYALGCPSSSRVSQLQRLVDSSVGGIICAAFLLLATLSRIFYTFSGFSGDAIGWNAWVYLELDDYLTPIVLAICANAGSVMVNGPYTERLLRELREKVILSFSPSEEEKLQVQYQQTLAGVIKSVENASVSEIDLLIQNPQVASMLESPTMQAKYTAFFGDGHVPKVLAAKTASPV